jgi:hypothetical protein
MPASSAEKGIRVVQDFILLDKRAYGPFTDGSAATSIRFEVDRDPGERDRWLGSFRYEMGEKGWAGVWMRCGTDWGGQDWRKAKTFRVTAQSHEPLVLELGFNDRNQNAYVAFVSLDPAKQNNGWSYLEIPMDDFKLNPYYQPKEGKKGAPRDLSRIETFNIAPQTPGAHSFKVREISIKE